MISHINNFTVFLSFLFFVLGSSISIKNVSMSQGSSKSLFATNFTENITMLAQNNSNLSIKFQLLNYTISNTYIVVSFNDPVDINKYSHQKLLNQTATLFKQMDLNGLRSSLSQIINIQIPSEAQILYYSILCADSKQFKKNVQYNLTIQGNPLLKRQCINGSNSKDKDCECNNMSYFGADCSLSNNELTKNFTLSDANNYYFNLSKVSYELKFSKTEGLTQIYIKQVQDLTEFASFTSFTKKFSSREKKQFSFGFQQKNISICIRKFDNANTTFQFYYINPSGFPILFIILICLVLLIILSVVIGCICFWYKKSSNQTQIFSENALLQNQNVLNSEQISKFFPTVYLSDIKDQIYQTSQQDLKQMENYIDKDCVICLCPIELKNQIKVNYCTHMFHSHCLLGWFKKQMNCPYCRQDYSRENTIEKYSQLVKINGNKVLEGIKIPKAILNNQKKGTSLFIQNL